ncbi:MULTISPECIES: TetR/AcrR family transcriptional regulator [Methylocaldum]|uniref:TetR/AcrR family transcriptional regulator n=1 Tax=unclassified Methylocaldum TaxID=2622260 RepID=UPI00098AD3BB|nr:MULTISPECIES: TetR/AcrR family transcriptional regulator [unclassified Methylocaldum]MBP1153017.1 TetR/AcrR family transcriptional repressor of nem operon [Methylocaldum sp. RMAD-M]MDV3241827.1 TetR/AcrR family transcriptional regulator [Methylocaldum sp.]
MARPREFDYEHVLDKAVETFWSKGYEATSIQDLVDATGLHRGSLYAAFGNKQALFLEVLDRYNHVVVQRLLELLDSEPSGKSAIRFFFATVIEHILTAGPLRGCLVTNSAVERGLSCPDTAAKVGGCLERLEQGFRRTLERMRKAGELREEADIRALSRYLTSVLQGLLVIGKVRPEREVLADIVAVGLSVLD